MFPSTPPLYHFGCQPDKTLLNFTNCESYNFIASSAAPHIALLSSGEVFLG